MTGARNEPSEAELDLRAAVVVAVLLAAPFALAGMSAQALAVAWAGVLVVYVALLWLFGIRSALEMGVFAFVLAVIVAGVECVVEHRQRTQPPAQGGAAGRVARPR